MTPQKKNTFNKLFQYPREIDRKLLINSICNQSVYSLPLIEDRFDEKSFVLNIEKRKI